MKAIDALTKELALEGLSASEANRIVQNQYAALDAAGFAIVPKEPTLKMLSAGGERIISKGAYEPTAVDGAFEIWNAMLAASKDQNQ